MSNYTHLVINKNRGWRGLAEAKVIDLGTKDEMKMIFSFSQAVWEDLILRHKLVMQDQNYYYIMDFTDPEGRLPSPNQQRSVLIKSFNVKIQNVNIIKKTEWTSAAPEDWVVINHFIKNKNNHTTSDWNCIGIRVTPEI